MFHFTKLKYRKNIDAYVCNLEIKLRWNELLCSQEIVNRHFERKECFSGASCKILCKFLKEAKVQFLLSDAYRIITLIPMFAMYRVKVEIIHFRSFDGGSVRIKGVKSLYFSGAGTFPQFSAGHRNLSCYPRPNSLPQERQLMSQQDHM